MSLVNPFQQRADAIEARKSGPKKRAKVGCYAGQWYYDEENQFFYLKKIPDLAIAVSDFNDRYYLWTTPEEERQTNDPAAVIKSIKHNWVSGRVFEPDNPENVVVRDGKKYVNARQEYYAANEVRRRSRKAAA